MTRLVNLPTAFPSGIVDFEVKTSITPSFDHFAATQIVDFGEVWQENGDTTEHRTVSGFFVGETFAAAQAAADAVRLQIPMDSVPLNFSQSPDERNARVDFSYEIAVPL